MQHVVRVKQLNSWQDHLLQDFEINWRNLHSYGAHQQQIMLVGNEFYLKEAIKNCNHWAYYCYNKYILHNTFLRSPISGRIWSVFALNRTSFDFALYPWGPRQTQGPRRPWRTHCCGYHQWGNGEEIPTLWIKFCFPLADHQTLNIAKTY